eukprot:TRINITY_DN15930_c0_g1_i1.p1 TRINITY_DN15930_c0_g1~~TRINITY_DN15930_c0_g1_i1.p1  ORF type:complete len:315 (+),score=86.70 TRINITY_DN15930_c0_g1_i1:102-1046(+)
MEAALHESWLWAVCGSAVGAFAATGLLPLPRAVAQHRGSLQTLAAGSAALLACFLARPAAFWGTVNPWDLGLWQYAALWAVMRLALAIFNPLLKAAVGWAAPRYRAEALGSYEPEGFDCFILAVNSLVEFIMLAHLAAWLWQSEHVSRLPGEANPLNVAVATWVTLVVNDAIYAPTHWLMHHHLLYPYIHKHHHRVVYPRRFYIDAANEHPLEQIIGLSIMRASLWLASRSVGLHVGGVVGFFAVYSALQIANHGPNDLRFSLLGIQYRSGDHEMHHRVPSCNMAQYCMWFDKYLLGTYRPFTKAPAAVPPTWS